mgnify:FL=1
MCTIIFRFTSRIKKNSSSIPGTFILVANRDEYYERPTKTMHWQGEDKLVLSGKDEEGGGSWLGVSKDGRFAAITNFKETLQDKGTLKSRGQLVSNFLYSKNLLARLYLKDIKKEEYAGFNLLLVDKEGINYFSNRTKREKNIDEGTHVIGNILLDSNTPKTQKAKSEFDILMTKPLDGESNLIDFMQTDSVDFFSYNKKSFLETEHKEIPYRFIKSNVYGTRCTTVFSIDNTGLYKITEQTYSCGGEEAEKVSFEFKPQ